MKYFGIEDFIVKLYEKDKNTRVLWHQLPIHLRNIVETYIESKAYLDIESESRQIACVLYTMWKLDNYNHTGSW